VIRWQHPGSGRVFLRMFKGLQALFRPTLTSEMLQPNRDHLPKATRSNTVVSPALRGGSREIVVGPLV
jgi:hypothetical protein